MTELDPFRARLPLRGRLLALRRDALGRLAAADRIDTGLVRIVTDTSAALAAVDAEAAEAETATPGEHAVVTDDGEWIAIAIYSADRQSAAATLSPTAASDLPGNCSPRARGGYDREVRIRPAWVLLASSTIRACGARRLASRWLGKSLVVVAVDR